MDAAGAASISSGPSYAPEDPTLPKPWMGVIDGSTGLHYYWNPETNVTQYERPVAPAAPSLPCVPPPSTVIPKVTAIPMAQNQQTNSAASSQLMEPQMLPQAGQTMQQIGQSIQPPYPQPSLQFHAHFSQQSPQLQSGLQFQLQQPPGHQFAHSHPGQQLQQQQPGSYLQQQQPGLQLQQQLSGLQPGLQLQQQQQPGRQVQQQLPERQLQQHLPDQQMQTKQAGSQMQQPQQPSHQMQPSLQMQQHSQQISPQPQAGSSMQSVHVGGQQQMPVNPQIHYPKVPYPQVQQMPTSQVQQPSLQPRIQLQGQQTGFHKAEQTTNQYRTESEYAFSQPQPSGGLPFNTNLSSGNPPAQIRQSAVNSVHGEQKIVGPSAGDELGASLLNKQQSVDGIKSNQRSGTASRTTTQLGQGMSSNPLAATGPPPGMKEYREDPHVAARDSFYLNGSLNNPPSMTSQQQKHSTYSSPQPMQTSRIGSSQPQNFGPGIGAGFNSVPTKPMPGITNQAISGQPFSGPFPVRALPEGPGLVGPTDFHDISAADVYRRQHEVTAMGENVPAPFMTFETTGFPPEILREMHFAGFMFPTPIQAQSWPLAIQGRDIVAIAKTGSGKTLGYLIPAFLHLRRQRSNPQMGPTVLVLAPTRELATQIQDEAMKFGRSSGISCICLYGGAPKGPQLKDIERGADIVIATPGRLNDILEMNKINLRQISFLVLDEADRMLDMGFEPQIRKVVNEVPPRRQTLMYTATWPKEVRKIAGDLLYNPVQVNIGSIDELVANKAITQYVEVVPPMDKQQRLEQILRAQERGSKIIIFCSTKKQCDQLARNIGRTFGAASIHGDKTQGERDWALNQFRSGKSPILVATDVAARGLDIKDIRVVINYDFPTGIEDYVHRIGRTGRAGASGVAYTFFSDLDWKYAADLIKVLEGANQKVPPEVREIAARGSGSFKSHDGTAHWEPGASGAGRGGGGRWNGGFGRGQRDGGGHFGGRGSPGGRNDFYGGGRHSPGGRNDFCGSGRGSPGGRNDFYGGRGGRGRGFGGPGGRGRSGPGLYGRFGDGRGRFDNRRMMGERSRDRSYSRSPDRGRFRAYDRGRSRSHSRSSRSWSSRSRSWSSRSRSRSRSRSYDSGDRHLGQTYTRPPRVSGFDVLPPQSNVLSSGSAAVPPLAGFDVAGQSLNEASRPLDSSVAPASDYSNPPPSGFDPNLQVDHHVPTVRGMSPRIPASDSAAFPENEAPVHPQASFNVSLDSSGPGSQLDKS